MNQVLYFGAQWCAPCKIFKPLVEKVSQALGVHVSYIDVDLSPEVTKQYNVSSIPTIISVNSSGVVTNRHTGALTASALSILLQNT
jgi:thioredoxin 1